MRRRGFVGLAVVVLAPALVAAQAVDIDHQPVGCAVAERFPRLEARFAPPEGVAAARVVFQPENTLHWYSVAMKPEGPGFAGVLPQPKKELKAFQYYIEVTDRTLGTSRTANYTTTVATTAAACEGKVLAGSLGSASVLLQAPEGAAAVPIGFASTGVVAAGTAAAAAGVAAGATGAAAGTGAAAAGAGAGGGGGLSTGALVGIAAAGAAAAGAAVVVTRGGTTYEGTFNTQMVMTYFGCSHVHAMSGTVQIALDESGGSASGPLEVFIANDTVTSPSGPRCSGGSGPGIGNLFECTVSGSPGSLACRDVREFTFEQTTSHNTTAFAGALSGDVISGTLTLAVTGRIGNFPNEIYSASTTFPIPALKPPEGAMRNRVFVGLAVLTVTAVPVGAQTVEIGHEPVGGAVAERFPRLEARFAPSDFFSRRARSRSATEVAFTKKPGFAAR